MLGFGSVVSALGKHFTRQVLRVGAILVVVMGLSMMMQGTSLSGLDIKVASVFSTKESKQMQSDNTNVAVEKNGVQYVSSTLESGHYPDITVKPASQWHGQSRFLKKILMDVITKYFYRILIRSIPLNLVRMYQIYTRRRRYLYL